MYVIRQPAIAVSEKRLKDLIGRHGTKKLYQLTGPVVATRDLDLTLNTGELVAVISEMDTRGDRRRWLVDAGGIIIKNDTNSKIARKADLIISVKTSYRNVCKVTRRRDKGIEHKLIVLSTLGFPVGPFILCLCAFLEHVLFQFQTSCQTRVVEPGVSWLLL